MAEEEKAEEKQEQEEEVRARENYLRAARVLKGHEAEATVPSGILSVRRNKSIGYSPIPAAPKFVKEREAGNKYSETHLEKTCSRVSLRVSKLRLPT